MTSITSSIGVEEMTETLTGYEENDIERRFGSDVATLLEKGIPGLRALTYIAFKRDLIAGDVKDPDTKAYKQVMEMPLKAVGEFWPDEDQEPVPDEPVTPMGEGDNSAD